MTTQNGFHSVESLELSLNHRFFTAESETEMEQAKQELEELVRVYPNRRSNNTVIAVLGPVAEQTSHPSRGQCRHQWRVQPQLEPAAPPWRSLPASVGAA